MRQTTIPAPPVRGLARKPKNGSRIWMATATVPLRWERPVSSLPIRPALTVIATITTPANRSSFDLYVLSETENDSGSAHYVITQGQNMIEGDIQLPEETQGIGMLNFCIGAGCFSVQIIPNDVPLWEEAYITPAGNPEEVTAFNPEVVFFGSLTGTSTEVCDGLDNDCDGQVDEGLQLEYADNDGDGFGDPLQPLPCDTPGVANAADCDDANADINPNAQEICDGLDNDCNGIVDDVPDSDNPGRPP